MNILSIGGGPAGLYAALLLKKANPAHTVTVVERNKPFDTFGWGVVFSDQTLGNLQAADPETAEEILQSFNHWDDIDTFVKGEKITSGGHGFCGIGRKRLLNILQTRAQQLGVDLVFEQDVTDDQALIAQYQADLVIASDGLNSRIRTRYADTYKPDIELRQNRFIWLGTKRKFDAFTFAFEETPHGWFQAHAYQYDGETSTFIVETTDAAWRAAGLDAMSQPESIAFCEQLFAAHLQGHALLSNAQHLRGSAAWIQFPRVVCPQWTHWVDDVPITLMGDAAHTAHFSIGSGTKLALEDAIEYAKQIGRLSDLSKGSVTQALDAYQAARHVEVLKLQNAARNSMEWFEHVDRYMGLDVQQFTYSMLTRSQRISHDNLRARDAKYVADFERHIANQANVQAGTPEAKAGFMPPMFTPYRVRDVVLKNRIVVSPMAMYSAVDGTPSDFHLVHLGARALGGAALIFAEMTCVSADARITPACPGLYEPAHTAAWRRITDFVHQNSDAKIAVQIGHAGAKGSTRRGWDGIDLPLRDDGADGAHNWGLVSASEQQYLPKVSQTAKAMSREQMDTVKAQFVASTQDAIDAGFDWLELHCAHGYLLSSFISPLTNKRTDEFGGSLFNRCHYPLEVFSAMREVWPAHLPMSVRISAHDWVEGGITPDDAVEIAKLFKAAGADMIDCSSGQVSSAQRPVYGRMYQTPFADRIRNEVGIPTIAVGAIFEADHVNSIIAAGRADLCAIARPHLANPAWTNFEAAKLGYQDAAWIPQYESGRDQLERNLQREKQMATQMRTPSKGSDV